MMKVSAWFGSNTYGVRVGRKNREQFFGNDWTKLEVELDGSFHSFRLTDGFWKKCPEFRDRRENPVIQEWLRQHKSINSVPGQKPPWIRHHPPRMFLVPLGGKQFRLVR